MKLQPADGRQSRHMIKQRQCRLRSHGRKPVQKPAHAADRRRPQPRRRRSARSEEGRARGSDAAFGVEAQCDALELKRHHQERRLRGKRRRGEEDRGADRAIIVTIAGILSGIMRRRLLLRLCECYRLGLGERPEGSSPDRSTCTLPIWMWPNDSTSCSTNAASPSRAPKRLWNRTHPIPRMLMLQCYIWQEPIIVREIKMWRRRSAAPQTARSDAARNP